MKEGAIFPLTALKNRAQRRQFTKDANKIAGRLEEVNTGFIWHLFNVEGKTYKEIYIYFLDLWNKTIDELISTKKFTNVAIDRLFFERNYKPQLFIK